MITFEQTQQDVAEIKNSNKRIEALLLQRAEPLQESDNPLSIKDVAELTGLSVATLYGYCQRREIPYHKRGNRLRFFKLEIINWIRTGRVKTVSEIEADTDAYLSNKNKGLK